MNVSVKMVSVLKGTGRIFRLLGLGSEPLIVFHRIKILSCVIHIILIISQIYAILPYILYTRTHPQLWEHINNPLYAILAYTGTTLVYLDFVRNKSITHKTIDILDTLVKQSWWQFYLD